MLLCYLKCRTKVSVVCLNSGAIVYHRGRGTAYQGGGRELIPTRVKADPFQGFQNGASSESCPSASATGPMHDAQCGLVSACLCLSEKILNLGQERRMWN